MQICEIIDSAWSEQHFVGRVHVNTFNFIYLQDYATIIEQNYFA